MNNLLARINLTHIPKLPNVGMIVRMTERSWGLWPKWFACTCTEITDIYHLLDFHKNPKWCGPKDKELGKNDPTERTLISSESMGLLVDLAYWNERPLWVIFVNDCYVCMEEGYLVIV